MARSKHHRHKKRKGLQPKLVIPNSVWRTQSNLRKLGNKMELRKEIEIQTKDVVTQQLQQSTSQIKSGMGVIDEDR